MVPEGWEKADLKRFISIRHGFAFKSNYFTESGDYVLLTPGSFYESGGFRDQGAKTKYYVGPIPDGYLLNKGDLLLAMTEQAEGLLGSALIVPEDSKYLHNQRLGLVLVDDPQKVSTDFLYLFFNSSPARKQISDQASGTKVRHTSPDRLCSVIGLIPPLPEQKKIAQILSTWDQAITATERLLENSQQRKKGLMQQLLTGEKRLPGFEGEWENSILTEHCSVTTGNKDLQNKVENGEYPFFVRSSNIERIDSYSFDGEAILIPGDGRVGEIFHYIDGKFDFHQRVYKLSDFEGALGLFIYYYLKRFFKAEVIKHSVKATVDSLRMPVFTGMRIKLPSLEEQRQIVNVLSCSDKEIQAITQRLYLLKQEKKALMQQLLTGKRRVQVDTEAA